MIVHRFMSAHEYEQLKEGKVLVNHADHRRKGMHTSCKGFCFFTEEPDEAVHWLEGCVDLDWCVTMEVADDFLVRGVGIYADESRIDIHKPLYIDQKIPTMRKVEYWRTRYSLSDVHLMCATQKYFSMFPNREERKEIMKEFRTRGVI